MAERHAAVAVRCAAPRTRPTRCTAGSPPPTARRSTSSTRRAISTSHDAPIDLSQLHVRGLDLARLLLAARDRRLLPVLHALRAERLGGVDRGDRALPADLHGVHRASRRRCARTATSTSTSSTGCLPAGAGRVLSTLVDLVRIVFFAYAVVLTVADDAEDGQLQDDDRRSADESRLRRLRVGFAFCAIRVGAGRDRQLAARLQRARAPRDRPRETRS